MENELYIDDCKILHSIKLDGFDHVIVEKIEDENISYRLYQGTFNNVFGISEYNIVHESLDYLDTMREFIRRLGARLDALSLDRVYRGDPDLEDAPLSFADCVPNGMKENMEGKIIAIKADALSPEYRTLSHQLYIATGGFGTSPEARGRTVFATNIYSGEKERFQRDSILGVALPGLVPAWAYEKIVAMKDIEAQNKNTQPQQCESVISKIEDGKKQKLNHKNKDVNKDENSQKTPNKRRNKNNPNI